ncbi:unnamed protein product [Danaus chrysippus]|uniref:(African queen) hypothetical protein n=1 Tax=Danaus chrysippus TaxID=151541 RepID=A0A8J2W8Q8_9NEOP|nr:unnamed protein product [Danaus chrysippus]
MDGMSICNICIEKLLDGESFKQQVIACETILKQHYNDEDDFKPVKDELSDFPNVETIINDDLDDKPLSAYKNSDIDWNYQDTERAREFRARKALIKQQNKQQDDKQVTRRSQISITEKRANSAEATRRWREKKRGFRTKKQAKTAAERMKEYREKKKL